MSFATNRRASTRHAAVNRQTILQILDLTAQQSIRAKLVNISLGGALVLTPKALQLKQPHQARLENASEHDWIMVEPVRLGRSNEVGIRFRCPNSRNFLLASLGLDGSKVVEHRGEIDIPDGCWSKSTIKSEYS